MALPLLAAGAAGRAAVAGGGRAVATRGAASGGKTIDGKVTRITDAKPARTGGGKGSGAKGFAAGQAASDLLSMRGRGNSKPGSLTGSPARRILVAEFTVCMVVLAFAPLTKRDEGPVAFMKRASSVMGLFLILALVATAGRGPSKAAAGFGGLVTLGLLVSSRNVFTLLAEKLNTRAGEDEDDDGSHVPDEVPDPGVRPEPDDTPDVEIPRIIVR